MKQKPMMILSLGLCGAFALALANAEGNGPSTSQGGSGTSTQENSPMGADPFGNPFEQPGEEGDQNTPEPYSPGEPGMQERGYEDVDPYDAREQEEAMDPSLSEPLGDPYEGQEASPFPGEPGLEGEPSPFDEEESLDPPLSDTPMTN